MSTEKERTQIKALVLKEPREIIKVGELLAALEKIKEDNSISISVKQRNDLMTVAYICGDKECGSLHLAGGRDIEFNYSVSREIFINRSNTQDAFSVKKSELMEILKKVDKDKAVLVATMDDDGFYALASAFLCPHCDSIHLSANYYQK
jgi:predicted nucleotide-binding protein